MLLGKRPRPPMKRTTSLTEFSFDLNSPAAAEPLPGTVNQNPFKETSKTTTPLVSTTTAAAIPQANVAPRIHRRHSADLVETAQFLRSCSLCKRRLVPSRDIYMYRGENAFCSQECREQQINHDEKEDKCPSSTLN